MIDNTSTYHITQARSRQSTCFLYVKLTQNEHGMRKSNADLNEPYGRVGSAAESHADIEPVLDHQCDMSISTHNNAILTPNYSFTHGESHQPNRIHPVHGMCCC